MYQHGNMMFLRDATLQLTQVTHIRSREGPKVNVTTINAVLTVCHCVTVRVEVVPTLTFRHIRAGIT